MGHFLTIKTTHKLYHISWKIKRNKSNQKSKIRKLQTFNKKFVSFASKLKCSKKPIADVHFYTLNSIAF